MEPTPSASDDEPIRNSTRSVRPAALGGVAHLVLVRPKAP